MDIQNLAYAITQIIHNSGTATVVGSAVFALACREVEQQRRLAWIVLAGWLVQAMSGATFGGISYYYYTKLQQKNLPPNRVSTKDKPHLVFLMDFLG